MKPPASGVLAEPVGNAGGPIYATFEGWGPLKDGTNALLLGYFNRNKTQVIDIPIGPDNSIEPGGPDMGQPTHFLTGRQYGMFAILVPKDFGNKKLTWTINANGHKTAVQFWLNPPYWIEFFKNTANENEPPRIKFAMNGPEYIGPPREKTVATLTATVGQPLDLTAWAADQPPTRLFGETPGGDTAAPAAAGAKPAARPNPANEPPPAFIGGRVVSVAPAAPVAAAAAPEGRRPRGDIQVLWRKYRGPGDVKIARRIDRARERRRCEEVRRSQDHGDVQRARHLLAARAGERQLRQRRRRRSVLLDVGAHRRERQVDEPRRPRRQVPAVFVTFVVAFTVRR